ncbi:hypothetical protein Taro_011006 [Colocasia esculenta]|uniref:Uncharacterized protein n=1 Tax=Colocasia esculenta TaxID=4460 RepID=A0A843U4X6_COLES|nr:hypothetical protein [Colocasia esculenta]
MKGGGGGGIGAGGPAAHHQMGDPDDYKKKNASGGRRFIWDYLLLGLRAMLLTAVLLFAAYAVYFLQLFPTYCRHYYPHRRHQTSPEDEGILNDAVLRATIGLATSASAGNDTSLSRPPSRLQQLSTAPQGEGIDAPTGSPPLSVRPRSPSSEMATSLRHIVFGIAASAKLWDKRKEYIKVWWRPREMRGCVWLDNTVKTPRGEQGLLPRIRISADTSKFPYTHRGGHRSAIRISRIVSETIRNLPAGASEVRWLVMGDDDTVFFPDNLLRVLSKYDYRQPYYIGAVSESHLQNIYFSYGMAYGGGGFAISRPLAEALTRMQDRCIARYPALYGSDDRMQACMAELGVPLTREPGFHQYDVYGSLFGLLAAHPVAPLVSIHHLDVVEPVFPGETRVSALRKLFQGPVRLDSGGVMQQSICYDVNSRSGRKWTVAVSWGYAVQVVRGVMSPREVETPTRTFLNWYRRADYTAYSFNTRPVARSPCQKPFVFYFASAATANNATEGRGATTTVTYYARYRREAKHPACKWKIEEPSTVERVVVYKRADPHLWDRAPRRNCCRVRPRKKGDRTMTIDVGLCRDGEISQPQQP